MKRLSLIGFALLLSGCAERSYYSDTIATETGTGYSRTVHLYLYSLTHSPSR